MKRKLVVLDFGNVCTAMLVNEGISMIVEDSEDV